MTPDEILRTSLRFVVLTFFLLTLSACGGGSSSSGLLLERPDALNKIINYAKIGGVGGIAPTVNDYLNAGVSHVSAENLSQVNYIVKDRARNQGITSISQLQIIIDALMKITISSITLGHATVSSAQISWNVSVESTGRVEYGLSHNYGKSSLSEKSYLKHHSQKITSLSPNTLYHYRVVSKSKTGQVTVSGDSTFKTLGRISQGSSFDVKYSPPKLVNPTVVTLPNDIIPTYVQKYSACGQGKIYKLNFAESEDALVIFDSGSPLPYPVQITGGKNVIIRGLEIKLQTQPGNEAGTLELKNKKYNYYNPHPVVPGCQGLRLIVKNATHWVEGLNLDTNGHDADAIVVTHADPRASKVVIQNSLIKGVEGNMDLHGDIFQTQSGHLKYLTFENVTMRQAMGGVVLSAPVDTVVLRNVDYDTDTRFDSDDRLDDVVSGGFFADSVFGAPKVKRFGVENIYIKYKNANIQQFFTIGGKHYSSKARAGVLYNGLRTQYNSQIHFNKSPYGGQYVSEHEIGKDYNY